jgi:hypothetical protein
MKFSDVALGRWPHRLDQIAFADLLGAKADVVERKK